MSQKRLPVNIFNYHDYRVFLKDLAGKLKSIEYKFTYAKLSKRCGFTSNNMAKMVIDGKRNLSKDSIEQVAKGLHFNKEESKYFRSLVLFNQATDYKDKDIYYKELSRTSTRYRLFQKDAKDLYAYYSKWYYAAIRELVLLPDFKDDPQWIADTLSPSITVAEAQKALQVLKDNNFIVEGPSGWTQNTPVITTGAEIFSTAVKNYHATMMQLAQESLKTVKHEYRNISSLTIPLGKKTYEAILSEIQIFQQKILDLTETETHTDSVYQFNFQLFPLTEIREKL